MKYLTIALLFSIFALSCGDPGDEAYELPIRPTDTIPTIEIESSQTVTWDHSVLSLRLPELNAKPHCENLRVVLEVLIKGDSLYSYAVTQQCNPTIPVVVKKAPVKPAVKPKPAVKKK